MTGSPYKNDFRLTRAYSEGWAARTGGAVSTPRSLVPDLQWTRKDIRDWLDAHHVEFDEGGTKEELLALVTIVMGA